MPEFQRLNLRLNLANPLHRKAWDALSAYPPGYRTDAVCRAVLEQREKAALRAFIQETIHKELKTVAIQEKTEQPVEETGDDDAVLGFLRALQEGGDEP